MRKIPVTVIIVTRNEEESIARCIGALGDFHEIIVVDSYSTDRTGAIANGLGAKIVNFRWNGRYPKKRQWCLDTLALKNDWVFFVDADEWVTEGLVAEIRALFVPAPTPTLPRKQGREVNWNSPPPPAGEGWVGASCAGYFISGRYVWGGRVLEYGLRNNKIALLNRRKMCFPVVDDLDIPGMGEIEGHYQPVLKEGCEGEKIGRLRAPLLHFAQGRWKERHRRYARWEAGMNRKKAWPEDPVRWRQCAKRVFRALPFRGLLAFFHCYVWKIGFLDGLAGLSFAASRFSYYWMILIASIRPDKASESLTPPVEGG